MMDAPAGPRLGVDPGSVRVGLAISDPAGILASPLVTLRRDAADGTDLDEIAALARVHGVCEIVVGLPTSLSGRPGPAAREATQYAHQLASRLAAAGLGQLPVRLADERLTTVMATRTLTTRGVKGKRQRAVIDQAAAVLILQSWLDRRRTGTEPETTQAAVPPAVPGDNA